MSNACTLKIWFSVTHIYLSCKLIALTRAGPLDRARSNWLPFVPSYFKAGFPLSLHSSSVLLVNYTAHGAFQTKARVKIIRHNTIPTWAHITAIYSFVNCLYSFLAVLSLNFRLGCRVPWAGNAILFWLRLKVKIQFSFS